MTGVQTCALPISLVQFDLTEGRASAAAASLYAAANDPLDFAAKIAMLIDDPALGIRMGEMGAARVVESLSWAQSSVQLLAAYDRVFAKRGSRGMRWRAMLAAIVITSASLRGTTTSCAT